MGAGGGDEGRAVLPGRERSGSGNGGGSVCLSVCSVCSPSRPPAPPSRCRLSDAPGGSAAGEPRSGAGPASPPPRGEEEEEEEGAGGDRAARPVLGRHRRRRVCAGPRGGRWVRAPSPIAAGPRGELLPPPMAAPPGAGRGRGVRGSRVTPSAVIQGPPGWSRNPGGLFAETALEGGEMQEEGE